MYRLVLPDMEYYNSATNEFITIPGKTYRLEHSLISVSKWEAKWHRPFLSKDKGPTTRAEILDYISCMSISEEISPYILQAMDNKTMQDVLKYIDDPMTATTFSERKNGRRRRASSSYMTSEVIYWQMASFGIPYECEKWHLNRLLTLIRVCDEKGQPAQKMSQADVLRQYAGVNAKRRKPKKH